MEEIFSNDIIAEAERLNEERNGVVPVTHSLNKKRGKNYKF